MAVIREVHVFQDGELVAVEPYGVSDAQVALEAKVARRREIRRILRARLVDSTPLGASEIQQGLKLLMEYTASVDQGE